MGQLLDAATAAFRGSYRMCADWTADAVVQGLSVAVPPPPLPLMLAAPAAGDAMEVDGGAPAEAAPVVAAGAPGPEAMDVDAAPAAGAHAAAAPAAADPEAQLAAAVAAAAVAAAVRGVDGVAAAADAAAVGQATQQLASVQLDQQQAQQDPQLSAEELAQRAQQEEERAALLATRLADVLLPPAQQQEQAPAAAADAAPAAGSGAPAAAPAPAQLPSVAVDGHGLDWAIRWRHAGGLSTQGSPASVPAKALCAPYPVLHARLRLMAARRLRSVHCHLPGSPCTLPSGSLGMSAAQHAPPLALPAPQPSWQSPGARAAERCRAPSSSALPSSNNLRFHWYSPLIHPSMMHLPLRPAGGLEDWEVRCRCGVHDDDGERMIMCDTW